MPDALIATTTSPMPGEGSGNSIVSVVRSPGNVTAPMASSVPSSRCSGSRLPRALERLLAEPFLQGLARAVQLEAGAEVLVLPAAVARVPDVRQGQDPPRGPKRLEGLEGVEQDPR